MKPQTVLAVGAGYLLGRTKKMKLALTLAGVGAGKLASSNGDGLLQQGSDLLRSSPAFNELVGDVRGQLLEAGKQAAASAARSQIDSMSERLLETRAGGRDGESEDSDDSEGSGARRQSSSSRSQSSSSGSRSSSSGSQSSSSGSRSSGSKQASKKQSASKRPAGKKAAQENSAKKRPANKRPANQERSGRGGSRSRTQKRSSSGSARRS